MSRDQIATGYRIDFRGRSVCYLTDYEHPAVEPEPALVDLARGADLVIYDAMYTHDEYASRVGWGHSTWKQGIRLIQAAGARQLALFHHDPSRDDAAMDAIVAAAARVHPGTFGAREGMLVDLGAP